MAEQQTNEFKELPLSVQVRIARESQKAINDILKSISAESMSNQINSLKYAYLDLLKSSALDKWRTQERNLKAQSELVDAYEEVSKAHENMIELKDKKIEELTEVIQKKVERLNT